MNHPFAARAELYRDLDRKHCSRTRFFGAAALVNTALAELWPRCALTRLACRPGLNFLATLGDYLQTFNVAMLPRIELGQCCAVNWDTSLVRCEQIAVEGVLVRLKLSDHRMHTRVTRQLDQFLYCLAQRVGRSSYGPNAALLSDGLHEIQAASARNLQFASLSDRVTVGVTLVRMIRGSQCEPRTRPSAEQLDSALERL